MSIGARIFGALAGVLLVYLLVGLLLPGSWEARAEALLSGSPEEVFPFLNRTDQWIRWTPLPETGFEAFGPPEGTGAALRWNDRQYGTGEFRILDSQPGVHVVYEVAVEGGDLRIRGVLTLFPEDAGTRIEWKEVGDFGWNPLLGYAARGMAESQGESMRASLERLGRLMAPDPPILEADRQGLRPLNAP